MPQILRLLVLLTFLFCGHSALAEKPKVFIFRPVKATGPFPVALWLRNGADKPFVAGNWHPR